MNYAQSAKKRGINLFIVTYMQKYSKIKRDAM